MEGARERLDAARRNLEGGLPFVALGLAYYAMLYAARAALSEEDLYAKTHSGSWTLFSDTFVRSSRFPADLVSPVQGIRERREGADYEAQNPTSEQAESDLRAAERFVAAVATLIGA